MHRQPRSVKNVHLDHIYGPLLISSKSVWYPFKDPFLWLFKVLKQAHIHTRDCLCVGMSLLWQATDTISNWFKCPHPDWPYKKHHLLCSDNSYRKVVFFSPSLMLYSKANVFFVSSRNVWSAPPMVLPPSEVLLVRQWAC